MARLATMPMMEPKGLPKKWGSHISVPTTAPVAGPKAKPATRTTIPEGSYLRYGAAGKMGTSTKLRTMAAATNSALTAVPPLLLQFDEKTDRRLLYRRLGVCANEVAPDGSAFQLDLFTDYEALERDRRMQGAMLEVRKRYGANAVFKGMDLLKGATALERNRQIGGHKA